MQPVTTTLVGLGGWRARARIDPCPPFGKPRLDVKAWRGLMSGVQVRVSKTKGVRVSETEGESERTRERKGEGSGLLTRVLPLSQSIWGSPTLTLGPRNLSRSKVDGCVQK